MWAVLSTSDRCGMFAALSVMEHCVTEHIQPVQPGRCYFTATSRSLSVEAGTHCIQAGASFALKIFQHM